MKKLFLLVFSIFFVACFNTTTTTQILDSNDQIEFYNTSDKYPFSEATVVNNVIYLSGKIGTDPSTGELVEGGIAPETKQIMDNIKNTLTKMGSSMDNIFKCTCMLADIKDWPLMSQEYKKFFNPQKLPARSAFAGSGLALGAKLEIECMAIKKN